MIEPVKPKQFLVFSCLSMLLYTLLNWGVSAKNSMVVLSKAYNDTQLNQTIKLYYDYDVDMRERNENTLSALIDAYEQLADQNYYEIHQQPLVLYDLLGGDKFLYLYEEGYAEDSVYTKKETPEYMVKTLELSPNCFQRFDIKCEQGDVFSQSGFHHGEQIPVVLGAEYAGVYAVGDVISASYIFEPITLKVTGILEKDSKMTINTIPVYLDRYMLIPSWNCVDTAVTKEEITFQCRHYVNKIEGYYEAQDGEAGNAFLHKISVIDERLPGKLGKSFGLSGDVIFTSEPIIVIANIAIIILVIVISIGVPFFYLRNLLIRMSSICVMFICGKTRLRIFLKSYMGFLLSSIIALFISFLLVVFFRPYSIALNSITYSMTLFLMGNVVFGVSSWVLLSPKRMIMFMGGEQGNAQD